MGRLSPHAVFLVCVAVYLAVAFWALEISSFTPWLGISFSAGAPSQTIGVLVESTATPSPAAGSLLHGDTIIALQQDAEHVLLDARLLRAGPDRIQDHRSLQEMFKRLDGINAMLSSGNPVTAVLADGRRVQLMPDQRTPWSVAFVNLWPALTLGALAFLFAATIWMFHPERITNRRFALAGALVMLAIVATGVVHSRSLGMSGETVDHLLVVRHASLFFLIATLFNLSWTDPCRLPHWRAITGLSGALAIAATVNDAFCLTNSVAQNFSFPMLAGDIAIFVAQTFQLRTAGMTPEFRQRSRWVAAAVLIGTGGSALGVAAPQLSGIPSPFSATEASWVLMDILIAAGVYRAGLFEVDRWVLSAWLLLLAGVATVAINGAVVYALGTLSGRTAIVVVCLFAWGYFPLQQSLWLYLARRMQRRDFRQLAPELLEYLLHHDDNRSGDTWPAILRRVFAPGQLTRQPDYAGRVRIARGGTELWLPAISGSPPLKLTYADSGRRLFTDQDQRLAVLLSGLVDDVRRIHEAADIGSAAERRRVARSLHDEVMPPLLSLIYRTSDTKGAERLREMVRRLRATVRKLNPSSAAVSSDARHE